MVWKRTAPNIEFQHLELTKCFGIQPIIVNPDGTVRCNLFNLYRKYRGRKSKGNVLVRNFTQKESNPRFIYHHKTDEEKQEIVKNAINYYQLPAACIRYIYNNGRHYQYDITAEEFVKQGPKFIANRLYIEGLTLYVYNKLVNGNTFVTSNSDILDNFNPLMNAVGTYWKILAPENLVPKTDLIVCAHGYMTFDNGILLCPLIYKQELNKWMYENGKFDDLFDKKFKDYPVMREYASKMDLYGEFINEYIPLEWHFEVFEKNVRRFYSIIHFAKS